VCISFGAPTIASTGQAWMHRVHPMHARFVDQRDAAAAARSVLRIEGPDFASEQRRQLADDGVASGGIDDFSLASRDRFRIRLHAGSRTSCTASAAAATSIRSVIPLIEPVPGTRGRARFRRRVPAPGTQRRYKADEIRTRIELFAGVRRARNSPTPMMTTRSGSKRRNLATTAVASVFQRRTGKTSWLAARRKMFEPSRDTVVLSR